MNSSIKATTTIDDLPVEMIVELFRHLELKDLAACPQVNKRWHSIYAAFRLDRLAVFGELMCVYKYTKWNYPVRRVEQKEQCSLVNFNRLIFNLVDKPLLSKLKNLALCVQKSTFDLDKLNRLNHLVHLEIQGSFNKKKVTLKLPKLKVLVAISFSIGRSLSIDCPELEVLVYNRNHVKLLEVKHPEISKLETDMMGSKLTRFNVECLLTKKFELISKATLLSLPKLKELNYNASISELWGWNSTVGKLAGVKAALQTFLDDLKILKRPGFKFTFAGFQMTSTMLNQIDFGVQVKRIGRIEYEQVSDEYVYMKNYQLIEPGALHFVSCVGYNRLMNNATGQIPNCFTQKFSRIEWVYVSVVQNEAHLLRFLKSLKWLRILNLDRPELSQQFYDQLPASAHFLSQLSLSLSGDLNRENAGGNVKELELNFDFIGELPHLFVIRIYKFVPFESLSTLIRWLGRLRYVTFYFRLKERKFCFSNFRWTDGDSKVWQIYEIIDRPSILFKSENTDEILNFLQTLKNQTLQDGKASD